MTQKKIDTDLSQEVCRLLKDYLSQVSQSGLTSLSVAVYQTHATNFVRWIHGEFIPGQMLSKKRVKTLAAAGQARSPIIE